MRQFGPNQFCVKITRDTFNKGFGVTLRSKIRNYRFFYKPDSRALYKSVFRNWMKGLLLPFYIRSSCSFKKYDGSELVMPTRHWPMLTTTCRLIQAGAAVIWRDDEVEAHFGEYCFYAPADSRLFGPSIQSIFVDDEWRIRDLDLKGQVAVTIGGHIGIVAVALAKKGATVHVFEPFSAFVEYIKKNALANKVGDRIIIHPVGLSDGNRRVSAINECREMASHTHGCTESIASAELVDAISYLQQRQIRDVALLEMNCEGCEYRILTQDFIDLLRPERIHMEFHKGASSLVSLLERNSYEVEHDTDLSKTKGKLFATRVPVLRDKHTIDFG